MKIFYFTATGNSLYIAKRIGGELYSIPQMIKEGKFDFEDDAIGFVFPCHGWGVARLIRRFIKRSKFNANYFFAIMTYGGTPKSGLQNMEQIGSKAGIQFNYTNEIFMIDNYLPNFEMEDEIKKEESKKIEEKLSLIIADVKIRKNRLVRKGCASVLLSKGGRCLSDKLSYNSGKKFIIQDNCNGCEVCAKVCPAKNIKVQGKPSFSSNCEMCFACIHHCPQNAIHLKSEKSNARFINKNIKLQEIIAANNQCNPRSL
jgi:ferredoxin